MTAMIELDKSPSKLGLYFRAVTAKKPGKLAGKQLPTIAARLQNVVADPAKLKQYREVCGFPVAGSLPATYPHILAFPLHMEILVSPEFPFPLMGLVHVKNQITQYRAIGNQETMDIHCEVQGPVTVAKGLEFDMLTKVKVGAETVWEGVSTFLYRCKTNIKENKSAKSEDTFVPGAMDYWSVPENIGRSYAKVSGDSNPIHLHPMSAKLLGFPKAIAHGMWSKAHALACLDDKLPSGAFQVDIAFKLPIFLPAKVQFQYATKDGNIEMRLKDKNGEKPHFAGSIKPL